MRTSWFHLPKSTGPPREYEHELRDKLTREFPGTEFYYLPTDMVSQILNFGLPAPIDVQMAGLQMDQNRAIAEQIMQQISRIPGTTDLRIQQPFNLPKWTVNVDRTRAQQVGYSQRDVAQDMLTSLSGSFQTNPTFYLNPQNHVSYNIAVQTPQYDVRTCRSCKTSQSPAMARRRRFWATWPRSYEASNRDPEPLQRAADHRCLWLGRRD